MAKRKRKPKHKRYEFVVPCEIVVVADGRRALRSIGEAVQKAVRDADLAHYLRLPGDLEASHINVIVEETVRTFEID